MLLGYRGGYSPRGGGRGQHSNTQVPPSNATGLLSFVRLDRLITQEDVSFVNGFPDVIRAWPDPTNKANILAKCPNAEIAHDLRGVFAAWRKIWSVNHVQQGAVFEPPAAFAPQQPVAMSGVDIMPQQSSNNSNNSSYSAPPVVFAPQQPVPMQLQSGAGLTPLPNSNSSSNSYPNAGGQAESFPLAPRTAYAAESYIPMRPSGAHASAPQGQLASSASGNANQSLISSNANSSGPPVLPQPFALPPAQLPQPHAQPPAQSTQPSFPQPTTLPPAEPESEDQLRRRECVLVSNEDIDVVQLVLKRLRKPELKAFNSVGGYRYGNMQRVRFDNVAVRDLFVLTAAGDLTGSGVTVQPDEMCQTCPPFHVDPPRPQSSGRPRRRRSPSRSRSVSRSRSRSRSRGRRRDSKERRRHHHHRKRRDSPSSSDARDKRSSRSRSPKKEPKSSQ